MKDSPTRHEPSAPAKPDGPAEKNGSPEEGAEKKRFDREKALSTFYDAVEVLATVTVFVMLMFAFVVRINVVDGSSMLNTLHEPERLAVSDLFYTPKQGDIVIIHRIDAAPYNHPIVKRVIAVGGQTVDIDFDTWTLTVDGEVVEEPYRFLDPARKLLTCEYELPVTLGENEIFVMGDNRNGSADSRQIEIGPVDRRTVVGRALARIYPPLKATLLKNPFSE